jgi:hypothetical protein
MVKQVSRELSDRQRFCNYGNHDGLQTYVDLVERGVLA